MRNLMLLTGAAVAIALAVITAPRPLAQSFGAPAGTVPAPDPKIPLYFEAASIKPSNPSNPPGQGTGVSLADASTPSTRQSAC